MGVTQYLIHSLLLSAFDYRDNGGFALDRSYNGETLTLDLPPGMNACQTGTFTIWHRLAATFFSFIEVPRTAFVSFYPPVQSWQLISVYCNYKVVVLLLSFWTNLLSVQVNNGADPCTVNVRNHINCIKEIVTRSVHGTQLKLKRSWVDEK